jgi:hypothetical protein
MFQKFVKHTFVLILLCICLVSSSEKCAEDDIECHERSKYTKGTVFLTNFELKEAIIVKIKNNPPNRGKRTSCSSKVEEILQVDRKSDE